MPPRLEIIFENQHWLAVNKLPKYSVERSPFGETTIESLVYDYLSKAYRNPYVGIVHRLDRVTTGILLFAKRKSILRRINEQFRERQIRKTYLTLVENKPPHKNGTLTNFLWKDRNKKKGMVSATKIKGSVESVLNYKLIEQNDTGYLLEINPLTGKFHQIRVQLSHIGCPILGDEKYGATKIVSPNAIALHAWKISLINPTNEKRIELKATVQKQEWWNGFREIL